jgi:hypothetical protein
MRKSTKKDTGEFGKSAIIFAKSFAISGYAWYTVWALSDAI